MKYRKQPLLTRDEEAELAGRIRKGDVEARNELITRNRGYFVGYSRRYAIRHDLDFNECLSAVDRALLRAADDFRSKYKCKFITFASWKARSELNMLLYFRSREQKRKTDRLDVMGRDDECPLPIDPTQIPPHDVLTKQESRELVEYGLKLLPSLDADVLRMHYFQGMTLAEIGSSLGYLGERASAYNVKRRALDRLGKLLIQRGFDPCGI